MVDVLRLVGSLLLIVGGFSVAAWTVRRTRGGAGTPLHVEHRVPIAKGSSVAIVTAGGRRLLVGAGEHGVTLLAELGEDDDPAVSATTVQERTLAPQERPFAPDAPPNGPWKGLIRRLQLMTLRRPGPRSFRAGRG